MKIRFKRGDMVVVISGSHRGKQGKILQILPRKNRAIVEGVNLLKRHLKKSQDHPEGAIVEREGSIHLSNLMPLSRWEQRRNAREPAAAEGA